MIWRRIGYGLLVAADLIALLYTGERVYLLILLSLIMLAALLWLQLLIGLLTFAYIPHFSSTEATAGQRVDLEMVLSNESALPMPYLQMQYRTLDSAYEDRLDSVAVSLPPRSRYSVPCQMEARYRGVYDVGPTVVRLRDVLGLFSLTIPTARLTDRKLTKLVILPRVEPLPMVNLPPQQIEGATADDVHRADDPAQLAGIREYRPGDTLKRIHWKQTMRTRKLQVKEFEEPSRPDVLIYLDRKAVEGTALEAIRAQDAMTSAVASLAHRYLNAWVPVRVVSLDSQRREIICRRPNEFPALHSQLAQMDFDSENTLSQLLALEGAATLAASAVVVVTADVDHALFGSLTELAAMGASVTVVLAKDRSDEAQRLAEELSRTGILTVRFSSDESLATCWEEAISHG